MLMKRSDSLLLIIDVQEKLAPAMDSPREVITGCARLIKIARELGVPYLITEQNPKGLGPTMVDLRQAAGEETEYLPKTEFSCWSNRGIRAAIETAAKKQIILAGIEANICIVQTAIALKEAGYEVFVVSDAVSARQAVQVFISLQRLQQQGVQIVSSEMVIFEWLQSADDPQFKPIITRYVK